jgi:peptidoglycan-associated lipoprotein
MMRRIFTSTHVRLVPIFLATLLAFAAGCASTPDVVEEVDVDSEFSEGETVVVEEEVVDVTVSNMMFKIAPVYFQLDKSDIRPEFATILRNAATNLKDTGKTVVIEGNCDERGSEEYNLALGERRAVAVRKYLYNLGVPMGQMTVVSYGEARPAVSGTGEAAWQLNRRVDFSVR